MKTGNSLLIMAGCAGLALALSGLVHSPANGVVRDSTQNSAQFTPMQLPIHAIFARGTTPRQMEAAYRNLLKKYGVGLEHMAGNAGLEFVPTGIRWPGPVGTPVNLTYSFPPDGTNTNGNGPNTIHATFGGIFGSPAVWQGLFDQALNAWGGSNSGNTYTQVNDDGAPWPNTPGSGTTRGDLRIVSAVIDGGGGVLAFNFFPTTGDMLVDSQDSWGQGAPSYLFFKNVATHELGHGNGLAHVCPSNGTKLMEPFINLGITGPQLDDRLAIQSTYGDPLEPNNTIATAAALEGQGLVSNTLLAINNLSLHSPTDGDLYSFQANPGSMLNSASAAAAGSTYLSGAQNGGGSCSQGTSFNALNQLDLVLELLNSSGGVIATANATGAGGAESLNGITLTTNGPFYLRVRANNAGAGATPIQGYRFTANINLTTIAGDVNGDGAVNAADLASILGVWGAAGGGTPADLNSDGVVDASDLATLLGNWTG